jgi:hypothetical protein
VRVVTAVVQALLRGWAQTLWNVADALDPQPDPLEVELARMAAKAAHPSNGPWSDGEAG